VAAVILLVITVTFAMVITRVGSVALALTGMSQEAAQFQARSAFYGVGFTTRESEAVVNHPVRRQIIMALMVLGNLGIVTMMASLIVSVTTTSNSGQWGKNLLTLGGGLGGLWAFARSRYLSRALERLITKALRRWTDLDVRDYVALLHLAAGYAVLEMQVEPGDWLAERTLRELNLSQEGILVLGIRRPNKVFVGAPTGQTRVGVQDTLIIYGPIPRLKEIDCRRAGPDGCRAHEQAVDEQARQLAAQHPAAATLSKAA